MGIPEITEIIKRANLPDGFGFRMIDNRHLVFMKEEGDRLLLVGGGDLQSQSIRNINCSICFKSVEGKFFNQEQELISKLPRTIKAYHHQLQLLRAYLSHNNYQQILRLSHSHW